jgi:hypothetical protein
MVYAERAAKEVDMGTATRLLAFVIATTALVGSQVARAAEEVDLLLVLSSDISRSIDAPKFKLQRDGYAAAVVNPRVIQAIRSGARQGRDQLRGMVGRQATGERHRLDRHS